MKLKTEEAERSRTLSAIVVVIYALEPVEDSDENKIIHAGYTNRNEEWQKVYGALDNTDVLLEQAEQLGPLTF